MSEATTPLLDAGSAGSVRLTGLITIHGDDVGTLEGTVRAMAANAALPGTHFCFVLPESAPSTTRAEIERVGRLLDGQRPWTILRAGAPDCGGILKEAVAGSPGEDIVLISPGAHLPFAWDARLRKAAYAASNICAAVPMCDVDPAFALVDEDLRGASRPDGELVDRTAYCAGDRSYYEVPGMHAVCVYLRRDALDAILPALERGFADVRALLDAMARRWRARGWCCVICDFLYVGYAGRAPAPDAAADDLEEIALLKNHPLGSLRRAVNDVIRRGLVSASVPGLDHRPVQLHVIHFWGGGLDKWVRDFGRADPARINMIFASYRIGETGGQRLVLYSDPAAMIPVRVWDIARPIRSTASGSIEYRRILGQIIEEFEVEAIIVSSLIGHALDALTQPRRTLVVCHDFYPICQAINPQFGKTCEHCTLDDLRRCARSNPLNNIFVDQGSEDWHQMRRLYVDHLLARKIEMVVPSPSVSATLRRLDPRLDALPIHLIPHGIDFDAPRLPIPPADASKPLRIVVLGRMSVQKGSELLRAACEDLRPLAEVTLLGCGGNGVKLAQECGWKYIERYEPDALPDLMRSIAPHAALLSSVIPETFSYTLSELWSLGVPPLATALGSFNDRIADGETGFLFEPDKASLVDLIRRLHARPEQLERVARVLAAKEKGRTTADMVRDYHTLLPMDPHPVARFRVGIGLQSGLTEPYRQLKEAYVQLTEAYAHLTDAYAQSTTAYERTRTAYDQIQAERDNMMAAWEQWRREFGALHVTTRWWKIPKAVELLLQLRDRMRSSTGGRDGD